VNLAAVTKGKVSAIVFTAPDCSVSKLIGENVTQLGDALAKTGGVLVEVVIGSADRPTSVCGGTHKVLWDKGSGLERAFHLPGTPFIVLLDKKGQTSKFGYGYDSAQPNSWLAEFLGSIPDLVKQ
jgi:hypothetical protein